MMKKFNLVLLVAIFSIANFINAQDMENVLEVGRDNQQLSAASQVKIDATDRMEGSCQTGRRPCLI